MIDYKNLYLMDQPKKKSIRHSLLVAGALGLIIAAMVTSCVQGLDKTMDLEEQKNAPLRQERERIMKGDHLVDAFQAAGSPVPHQMAEACRATSKPKTMAAIAIVESQGTPWAKGKAGEKGAWQVIGKHWGGSVPEHPVKQALQAEKILDELVAAAPRGSLRCALARYNGGDRPPAQSWRYADRVLKVKKSLG